MSEKELNTTQGQEMLNESIQSESKEQQDYIDTENTFEKKKEHKPLPKYLQALNKKLKKMNTPHHIKLDTIFDTIQDANSVFRTEKKTFDFVINLNKMLIAIIVIQLILIITLFPLKEKEPYLVGFSNATQNFVHIERANETITANEALIRNLLGSYIINRETINHFDDEERYEVIRLQSTPRVWKTFENIVAQENSIYGNAQLTRQVKIVNIAKYKKGYANAEIGVTLAANGMIQSQKRYRITIAYKFNDAEINFESLPKNPTGFEVQEYAVTEIATIKELDEENRVDPSTQKSKIKHKDKNDSNEFLRDYQFKDSVEQPKINTKTTPPSSPTETKKINQVSDEEFKNMSDSQKRQALIKEMQEIKKQQEEEESKSQQETSQNQDKKPNKEADKEQIPNPFS